MNAPASSATERSAEQPGAPAHHDQAIRRRKADERADGKTSTRSDAAFHRECKLAETAIVRRPYGSSGIGLVTWAVKMFVAGGNGGCVVPASVLRREPAAFGVIEPIQVIRNRSSQPVVQSRAVVPRGTVTNNSNPRLPEAQSERGRGREPSHTLDGARESGNRTGDDFRTDRAFLADMAGSPVGAVREINGGPQKPCRDQYSPSAMRADGR